MATVTVAMAGMWRKPGSLATDAVLSSTQPIGKEVRAKGSGSADNVMYRLNDETANFHGQLPGLSEVPRRIRGRRRRRESRTGREKKTDSEFDIVIVPPDGCCMSGSDSDDSDWSVGWFEPHPADFTENEGEESFAVLVPSYSVPALEFAGNLTGQSEEKDSKTPEWGVIFGVSGHKTAESQKQVDQWLASLTSPS